MPELQLPSADNRASAPRAQNSRPHNSRANSAPQLINRWATFVWLLLIFMYQVWTQLSHAQALAQLPTGWWTAVHLFTLGVIGTNILTWSAHFTQALARGGKIPNRGQAWRLAGHQTGAIITVIGMLLGNPHVALTGVVILLGVWTWHALVLLRASKVVFAGPLTFLARYYVWAFASLIVAVSLAAWPAWRLAKGTDLGALGNTLVLAHVFLNLLGFVGITLATTLVTFGPTVMRTKMVPQARPLATRMLPLLVLTMVLSAAGAVASYWTAWALRLSLWALVAYLIFFILGILLPLVWAAVQKPLDEFPAYLMFAGLIWLTVALSIWAVRLAGVLLAGQASGTHVRSALSGGIIWFLFGIAQVIAGSLAYLLPVMRGGGPAAARYSNAWIGQHGLLRVILLNLLLVLFWFLPATVSSTFDEGAGLAPGQLLTWLVLGALVLVVFWSLALVLVGLLSEPANEAAQVPSKLDAPNVSGRFAPSVKVDPNAAAAAATNVKRTYFGAGMVLLGLLIVAWVLVDPAFRSGPAEGYLPKPAATSGPSAGQAAGQSGTAEGAENGGVADPNAKVVDITVKGMSFEPALVIVPKGTHLVLKLHNTARIEHDLHLENGKHTDLLKPNQIQELDAGVIEGPVEGWCSVTGHRQMGMVFHIKTN
ncbi:hypothetical protein BSR29_01295 [Boudabousia liubingyangii]|uniref:EfeO-type cupredoxin-like domain-containing protein n=1 Tax=Boudabousia liubingyangii TaxID=1921764 RepID=A0A1Q5PQ36_9ACTO|nr:hypothetical protein [Boudabousia liubingyangii]OKL49622.1 hypothetical protein BSR29_01295 [Boudabousia liubingyangii]